MNWWYSPNPASAESLSAHDVPSSTVLGANFRGFVSGCRADCEQGLRGVQGVWQRSGIFNPVTNWFRLEPFKDTAVPETSGENVANPLWPNRRNYGWLQPPATEG